MQDKRHGIEKGLLYFGRHLGGGEGRGGGLGRERGQKGKEEEEGKEDEEQEMGGSWRRARARMRREGHMREHEETSRRKHII